MPVPVLLPLISALLAAPITALAGAIRTRWTAPAAILMAFIAFASTLVAASLGEGSMVVPWAPSWDLFLHFRLDGLALMYALLATGIGLAVTIYSAGYLPHHLQEENSPPQAEVRFYTTLLAFMGAMVGLVLSEDLLLLFLFWDITAVTSYFLIGFDHHRSEARRAALMALLVTGITSVLFLIGALLLYVRLDTFQLHILLESAREDRTFLPAIILIAIAALAKSAQVPFHFWLPRAMAAPTPVSAYLHSAAMVAAGVFLLGRIYPMIAVIPMVSNGLLLVGLISMFVGGALALTRDVIKEILAYSTIAQYGYVVFLFGLGGEAGVAAATFYVLAHAILKSSLFMTAGAVTQATGEKRLSRLDGLAKPLPLLSISSAVTAAGLAGLPLTIGFFKDELFFESAHQAGIGMTVFSVIGAAMTMAYTWRFWSGIFLGRREGAPLHSISKALVLPITALAILALLGGILPEPFSTLAGVGASASFGQHIDIETAYHLALTPTTLMTLATYLAGILLILALRAWAPVLRRLSQLGKLSGPERWYHLSLEGLNLVSRAIYARFEVQNLAGHISFILIPGAVLLGAGLAITRTQATITIDPIRAEDIPLALALVVTAISGITTAFPRSHLTLMLTLSGVTYGLALIFSLYGAPDVSLVAVLTGTLSTALFLAMLVMFQRRDLSQARKKEEAIWHKVGSYLVALVTSIFAFAVVWGVLSQPASELDVAASLSSLTPDAHAKDIVTAILADFRGLDTMGEISVMVIVMIGIYNLLRIRKEDRQA